MGRYDFMRLNTYSIWSSVNGNFTRATCRNRAIVPRGVPVAQRKVKSAVDIKSCAVPSILNGYLLCRLNSIWQCGKIGNIANRCKRQEDNGSAHAMRNELSCSKEVAPNRSLLHSRLRRGDSGRSSENLGERGRFCGKWTQDPRPADPLRGIWYCVETAS